MKLIKCDHCRKLKRPNKKESVLNGKWASGYLHIDNPGTYFNFDLCEKCSAKVVKFLEKYLIKD